MKWVIAVVWFTLLLACMLLGEWRNATGLALIGWGWTAAGQSRSGDPS